MAVCSNHCITVFIVLGLLCSSIGSTPCIDGSVKHTVHTLGSGLTRCCKSAYCFPGTEARICENEFERAMCLPCAPDKYNEGTHSTAEIDESTLCKDQVTCNAAKGFRQLSPHNPTRKTKCVCMPGRYLIPGAVPEECGSCNTGETLNSDGTGCEPCGNNSYSPGPGMCLNCTQCSDFEEMSQNCTIEHNVVCTPIGPTTAPSTAEIHPGIPILIVLGVLLLILVLFYLVGTYIHHRRHHLLPRRTSADSQKSAKKSLLKPSTSGSSQKDGPDGDLSAPLCPNGAGDSSHNQDPEKCASRRAHSRCWLCFCCPWCCHLCCKTDSSQRVDVGGTSHDLEVKHTPSNGSSGAGDHPNNRASIHENDHSERSPSHASSARPSSSAAVTSGHVSVSAVNTSLPSHPAPTQSLSQSLSAASANPEFTPANMASSASGTSPLICTSAVSNPLFTVDGTDPNTQTRCSSMEDSVVCPTAAEQSPLDTGFHPPGTQTDIAVRPTSSSTTDASCAPTAGSSSSAPTQLSTHTGRSSDPVSRQPSSDPPSLLLPSEQKKDNQTSTPVTYPAVVKSKYEDKLKNCCGDLVRDMEMNEAFLSDMMKNNTLSSNEKRKISQLKKKKKKEQDEAAASKLLDIVLEKGDPAIELLVESLVRNGEQRLARLIDEELCQQAVKEYTEDLSDFIQVRAELVRQIDITEKLLSHLMRCDVLKTNDKNAILQEKRDATRDTAPGHLLDIVQDKGRRAIQPLVEALVLCDQTDLACMIDPVYAKEYKENRPISGIEFTAQQQRALTASGPSLIQHLDISEMFLSVMRQENGITQEHCQQIANIQVKQTQNQCFLTILESRPRRSFEQFLKALEETEQTDMLEEIKKYLEEPVGSGHQVTDAELPHNRHAMSQAHDNIEGPLSLRADENETQVKVRNTVENSETRRKEIDDDDDSGTSLKKAARTENASNSIVDKTAVKQYDSENVTGSENYANGTDALTETSVKQL